jgi:outer membrane protein assembly factor BamB
MWFPEIATSSSSTPAFTGAPLINTGEALKSLPPAQGGATYAATGTWKLYVPSISKPVVMSTNDWSMAGANPQRTSWTSEQVPSASYMASHRNSWGNGMLYPQWYKPFEAYIPHNVQIIGANGLLYISTARGLYALSASTGDLHWVYPTELPLGHSRRFTTESHMSEDLIISSTLSTQILM